MKNTLTVFLSLMLSLILLSDRLPAQSRRCPFVVPQGTLTLNKVLDQNPYQFRAIRIGGERVEGRETTVFEVTGIIRNPIDHGIRVGSKMKIWEPTGVLDRDTELATGHKIGSAVILVSDSGFPYDASILCEADECVEAYLTATAAALKGTTDDTNRMAIFLPYVESECEVVARDALEEVVSNGYDALLAVRDKLPRELILQRIANPDAFPSQLDKYGMLAGLCATMDDAALLEKRLLILDSEYRHGIDGVMAGYLMIRGEHGLTVLENAKIRTQTAMTTEGNEIPLPFSETYALIQALRFIWDHAPDRISKDRLRQSMRLFLDKPELSDLAVVQLTRWKDWSLHDRLMLLYDDNKVLVPATRRAIVRYLLQSSMEKEDIDSEGTSDRPAHAVKAEELLKTLEEKDPGTIADVRRFLKLAD